jgi:phospho-N-acetylmuramoyl-pentapeptide-transferase
VKTLTAGWDGPPSVMQDQRVEAGAPPHKTCCRGRSSASDSRARRVGASDLNGSQSGGGRRHPGLDRETGTCMVRVLIAGLVAMVVAIVIGPTFIEWLRRAGVGQQIREEGPARHIVKQGTPTMGGLLILATAVVPFLLLSRYTMPGLALLFLTVGCAAIGFTDDYLKVRRRRSLGLAGRWKMLGLVLITIGVYWVVTQVGYLDTEIYFPVVDVNIDLGWFYFPFLFVVIAGTANGVNLTDGIDGLAAGTCAISLLTFLAFAAISWIRSGEVGFRSDNYLDVAIFTAALIGGVIGFLWFNAFPAELIMGDTGSMALGGAIAGLAVMTQTEVLLIFIGDIYLIEALSVMIQVASFKRTGKRVFLITPIHHHFEMKAWSETKIMVRFWIVGAIFCTTGFVLFYRYYLRFKL